MKVKDFRKFATKRYNFIDDEGKEFSEEFKFYELSTKQLERLDNAEPEERSEVVFEIFKQNFVGRDDLKEPLINWLYNEGNIYTELQEFRDQLGKQKKKK